MTKYKIWVSVDDCFKNIKNDGSVINFNDSKSILPFFFVDFLSFDFYNNFLLIQELKS